MSKIGKKPIIVPAGVTVNQSDSELEFQGEKGRLCLPLLPYLKISLQNSDSQKTITVTAAAPAKQAKANWGTMAALIKNALQGVATGFSKTLEIEGIGFKANIEGDNIMLHVGLTHPVKLTPPAGIKITVEKNLIKVAGVDKALVGETAANIRKIKKPEPYKGKGIHYQGEVIRRKAGKKVAGTGTAA